jgi:hypothetical protein
MLANNRLEGGTMASVLRASARCPEQEHWMAKIVLRS